MIDIKNLSKYFGSEKVLDDISLHVNAGDIFAIVGHSGAGKSTLLRCINGLEGYSEGSLNVFGKDVKSLNEDELSQLRSKIGMIFQNFSLLNQKNVFENIALPMKMWGYKKEDINKKVDELLNLVGLTNKKFEYPRALSGGQKQRVAIARALTLEPKILLSDEATSALDPNTTLSILELLEKINKTLGVTIIIVTHEMEVVKRIAEKALLLEHGKILGLGTIEGLFLKPDEKMRRFLGEEEELPQGGVNVRIFFPSKVSYEPSITRMARELNMDFSIVWGKIEKLNNHAVGSLVINVEERNLETVKKYLKEKTELIWEVI
ncbi:MAG: methionine ABC transporter ATP-binding protein [Campylobacteraceae bacterium]